MEAPFIAGGGSTALGKDHIGGHLARICKSSKKQNKIKFRIVIVV